MSKMVKKRGKNTDVSDHFQTQYTHTHTHTNTLFNVKNAYFFPVAVGPKYSNLVDVAFDVVLSSRSALVVVFRARARSTEN